MKLGKNASTTLDKLIQTNPISVFLYGSRARGDNLIDSDWELGVIYQDGMRKTHKQIQALTLEGVVAYSYELSEFTASKIVLPFVSSIWLKEINLTAKTVYGSKVVEEIKMPRVTRRDILNDLIFASARALDAMIAQRDGYLKLARDLFVKSSLFSMRDIIIAAGKDFPLSYYEIADIVLKDLPEEFLDLPEQVLEIRTGSRKLTAELIFLNIKLITKTIEELSSATL
jgi:predicted nucleotidyltransferase